jgi:tetratricopeptide (TPR) repeat protein
MLNFRGICVFLGFCAALVAHAAGLDITPTSNGQVIEVLLPRIRSSAATPEAAAIAAKQAITLAREKADSRYLGRAQATLQKWWDAPTAPVELAVLQATVHQGRHEFSAARRVLDAALKRDPSHAQGWLTLATIERVAGNYPAALAACQSVQQAGAELYARACELETLSLQGQHVAARGGLELLRRQTSSPSVQGWLLSLSAENDERAGLDMQAVKAYRTSLALAPDTYTAIAASDALVRNGRIEDALKILAQQPDSDAVLLRKAYALKLQNNPAWQTLTVQIQQRLNALDQRGDDPASHARERALLHVWLTGDGQRALQSAQLNLTLQKEPFDWWLAIKSAQLAGDNTQAEALKRTASATGLRDVRLAKI